MGRDVPPIRFDRGLCWYTQWFDPADDLCCAPDCRDPIAEDDVPLILFLEKPDRHVWQSRLHVRCAARLGLFRQVVT